MDPSVALADIRHQLELAERAPSPTQAAIHAENACSVFRGLDAFLSNGGFFPSAWTEAQRRALDNTRCERTTLAGTTVPTSCPPDDVDELLDELRPDPWHRGLTRQQSLLAEHVRRGGA